MQRYNAVLSDGHGGTLVLEVSAKDETAATRAVYRTVDKHHRDRMFSFHISSIRAI